MKKICLFAFIILGAVTSASIIPDNASAQKSRTRENPTFIPNHYIVLLDDNVVGTDAVEPEVETRGQFLTTVYGGAVTAVYSNAVKGFAVEMTADQAEKMKTDESVKLIEQDQVVTAASTEMNAPWHLDRVDQRSIPMDTMYNYSSMGTGVNIYLIDSGIRITHTDFGGRADVVFDGIGDGQNGIDCYGHGTHVAGIAGSSTYGVAKNARLHAVRVLNCSGQGSIAVTMSGIDWVTAHHVSPAVANLSLILSGVSSAMDTAVTNSINSGVTYAIAAGNFGADACNYTPAHVPAAITVGASSVDDIRPNFSNFGSCVDIHAPGYNVTSLSYASDTGTAVMSGTSQSAPMVAGAAALYLSSNPTASPATVANAIKSTATTGVLTNVNSPEPNLLLYAPLTNQPPPPTPTPTPTPTATPTPTPTPLLSARVRVKKVVQNGSGAASTVTFPYSATNLTASTFTLTDNTLYDDPNVAVPSGQTVINVTEQPVAGYQLQSISCTETSATGTAVSDSTISMAFHSANIMAEPGEDITCTFTSQPMSPTSAHVSVSGRVLTPDGRGLRNARVVIIDSQGVARTVTTSSFGYYQFDDVATGANYVIGVMSKQYRFTSRLVQVADTLTDANFIGTE